MKISTFSLSLCKLRCDFFVCIVEYFCKIIFIVRYDSNLLILAQKLMKQDELTFLTLIYTS